MSMYIGNPWWQNEIYCHLFLSTLLFLVISEGSVPWTIMNKFYCFLTFCFYLLFIYLKFPFLYDLGNRNILMTFLTFWGDRHHRKNVRSASDPKSLRKNSKIHLLHKTLVTAFSRQVNLRCCVQYHLYGQISWITIVLFF